MIAFLIDLQNKPGSAADVAEVIADRGINITGGAGIGSGSSGQMALASACRTRATTFERSRSCR